MSLSSGVTNRNLPSIQPLTARNVVLSTLLGYHPPELPIGALIRVGQLFGIADRTIRTAASRMVVSGDLTARDGVYGLSRRLVDRQVRQEASLTPATTPWDGAWDLAVVTAPPRPLAERVAFRRSMIKLRFAELRDGVWTRPANLAQDAPDVLDDQCAVFRGHHDDPGQLVATLWDLESWAADARTLTDTVETVRDLKAGFMASALVIRHLLIDPCLPTELLPNDWPGSDLRREYSAFIDKFAQRLREYGEG